MGRRVISLVHKGLVTLGIFLSISCAPVIFPPSLSTFEKVDGKYENENYSFHCQHRHPIVIIIIAFYTVNPKLGEPDAKNPKAHAEKTAQ